MVSSVDTAKRTLVTLLKSLAALYCVAVLLTRESSDIDVRAAYKRVARKAHPDKGGASEHQKALNAARDAWENALRAGKGRGGDRKSASAQKKPAAAPLCVLVERRDSTGYRFQGEGVLLTYQKFTHTGCWQPFLDHVVARLVLWKVKFWCATMETNGDGTYHLGSYASLPLGLVFHCQLQLWLQLQSR